MFAASSTTAGGWKSVFTPLLAVFAPLLAALAASSITDGGFISDVVPFAAFATSSTVSALVCLNCD